MCIILNIPLHTVLFGVWISSGCLVTPIPIARILESKSHVMVLGSTFWGLGLQKTLFNCINRKEKSLQKRVALSAGPKRSTPTVVT